MAQRGVTLADWTAGGYASASAQAGIREIARSGANTLVLIVTAYQSQTSDNAVRVDPQRTPSPAALATAIATARGQGLAVVIKPHVDLESGAWRGTIAPSNPDAWFASYAAFVLALAEFAEGEGASGFVVGTELAGTIDHAGRWRALIADARARFPGPLSYAASWDEAALVGFWDALDYVGVDFYAPVSGRDDPGRVEILRGWQPWLHRLEVLHGLAGRPIVLTEIGYRSVDGAGQEPYSFSGGPPIDLGEQADLYWAAVEAVSGKSWIEGMYWWNWLADGAGGPQNRDYTPFGKPAQEELAGAWTQ